MTEKRTVKAASVVVDTGRYVRAWSKTPRGAGLWAFDIAGEMTFFYGKYGDCVRQARRAAAERGEWVIFGES